MLKECRNCLAIIPEHQYLCKRCDYPSRFEFNWSNDFHSDDGDDDNKDDDDDDNNNNDESMPKYGPKEESELIIDEMCEYHDRKEVEREKESKIYYVEAISAAKEKARVMNLSEEEEDGMVGQAGDEWAAWMHEVMTRDTEEYIAALMRY